MCMRVGLIHLGSVYIGSHIKRIEMFQSTKLIALYVVARMRPDIICGPQLKELVNLTKKILVKVICYTNQSFMYMFFL